MAKFLFPYICSFLLYLHYMMLINVKLDITGHKRITFQSSRLHWSSSFLKLTIFVFLYCGEFVKTSSAHSSCINQGYTALVNGEASMHRKGNGCISWLIHSIACFKCIPGGNFRICRGIHYFALNGQKSCDHQP